MSNAEISFEVAPFRVRGWKDGRLVVDTRQAKLARGVKHYTVWMFPREAVDLPDAAITAVHDGHVAVDWGAVDEWWEEDEIVVGGHPRAMNHRVDARESSRHVVVRHDGAVIADSRRPVIVAETGLPNRFYLPRGDVDFSRLRRAERTSWCPYKGKASYYDIVAGDGAHIEGTLWSYEEPLVDAPPSLAGRIGIWHEKLDVTIDDD